MFFPLKTKEDMIVIWLLCVVVVFVRCSEETTTKRLTSILKWYPSREFGRPGGNTLPSRIDLTLKSKKELQLNLVKENDNIQDVQVFTKWNLSSEHLDKAALYMDHSKHAVFSVGVYNSKVTYYGEFVFNNVVWSLMPSIGFKSERQGPNINIYVTSLNGTQHYLQKEKPHIAETTVDDAAKQPKLNRNDSLVNKVDSKARRLLPTIVDGKQLYTIQVLVILDYSVYTKWLKNADGDYGSTIRNLKQYYAHIINGVKERYEGANIPGIKYTASLSGIYTLTSLQKAAFIERTNIGGGLSTEHTLQDIKYWVKSNHKSFPEFDVAAVFTDYFLYPNCNGMAYLGTVCTTSGVSINRDLGSFDTILTVSHEIGHNLGASHDSVGNHCRHEDQYIMALGRNYDKGRLFTFSPCSLYYFQQLISQLISKSMMCLNNLPENVFPKDVGQYLNQHPGQKLTLDEQCRTTYGRNSYFCGGIIRENICMLMPCLISRNQCVVTPAAEGTSCGDRKWCHRGGCVSDERAPEMNETCSFGDYKPTMEYSGYKYNCIHLIKSYPWLCHQEYYRLRCCESCDKLRKQNPNGCPYGDHHSSCDSKQCYSFNYIKECCETCKSAKFDSHGKLLEVCGNERYDQRCHSSSMYSSRCYELGKLCCKACAKFKVNIPDCDYGDKASWCKDHIKKHPKNCVSNKKMCCESCYSAGY